jgi:Ran GTPase-activating protein (RanGAP) involved in mRNA processing and transport
MAWEVMLKSGIIQQVTICGVVISRPFEATIDLHAKRPPLGPFGSQVLAPLLEVHPGLTRINLAANDVQDEGLKHLMVSMARREMAKGQSLRGIARVELQSNALTNRSSKVEDCQSQSASS